MLNLNNIPGGMISGAGDDELDWIAKESGMRYLAEFADSFLEELDVEENEKFPDLDEEIFHDLNELEKSGMPASTTKHNNLYVSKFRSFLKKKNLCEEFETAPPSVLNNYLRYFYSSLRKNDGGLYSPSSLICIRAAIHRFLISPSVNRIVNIIDDKDFVRANNMLKTMIGRYLKESRSETKVTPAIQPGDMKKLSEYFDKSNPKILQEEVWFDLMLFFGLRGRETVRQLRKESISIESDADGMKFARINHDTLSKNSKASLSRKEFESIKQGRMYAIDKSNCPVKALEMYLSKLPVDNNELFPLPLKKVTGDLWYCRNRVLGKNTLASMMKVISQSAKLSKIYTNHAIRVTTVTVLNENGFANHQIQSVTGHKNEQSVSRYVRNRNERVIRSFSSTLSNSFGSDEATTIADSELKINDLTFSTSSTDGQQECPTFNFNGTFNNCVFNMK